MVRASPREPLGGIPGAPTRRVRAVGGDGGWDVAQAFLYDAGNPELRVGAEVGQQGGRLRPALELKRLLGALGHPVGGTPAEVPRVDVCAVCNEILHHLVQAAERGSLQRREVGLVHHVDVGARLQQYPHRLLGRRGPRAARYARRVGGPAETCRHHQGRRAVVGRQVLVGARR